MATKISTVSEYVEKKARQLLQRRDEWRWVRNARTGVSFVAVPSPCTDRRCERGPESHDHIHAVHPLGKGCDCPAVQTWGASTCSHARAVQLAQEEDAQAAVVEAGSNLDRVHAETMATVSRPRVPYADLFAPTCRARGCTDDAAPGEADCHRHQLVDAF